MIVDGTVQTHERLAFDGASARSFDSFGRMHVTNCRISKANVCPYLGREIPNSSALGLEPNKVYKLYRDPKELEKAAPEFANQPLLMFHAGVTANDSKKEITVGTIGNVSFDGTYLVTDKLSVWDRAGIRMIETEDARELSPSYKYRAVMSSGITPEGIAYDGVMVDIHPNHIALVHEGRTGPDVLVADALPLELSTMIKRPKLLASLIAAGAIAASTTEAERLALDAKLAEITAMDADMDDVEDDPDCVGKKRKKKINPGAGEPTKVGGALANDAAIESAIVSKGYITLKDAQVLAEDAAVKASKDAVIAVNALHAAREAVKPLVGVVAMDSAEAVYEFALKQEKVNIAGVHPSAYPTLVQAQIAAKGAKPTMASDSATSGYDIAKVAPGMGRFG